MKHYGDMAFQEASAMIMQSEQNFPETATAGRIIFVDKRVWVCAELITGNPVWIPLTNEIDSFVHIQDAAATTWTVTHNLNTTTPIVQVYDENYKMIIPDGVEPTSNNECTVTLGTAITGRAVVMFGDITGAAKSPYAFEYTQTTLSNTWVVKHGLGYYPIVRVFVGGEEILPASIIHDSIFQTTITFSEPKTGIARFV